MKERMPVLQWLASWLELPSGSDALPKLRKPTCEQCEATRARRAERSRQRQLGAWRRRTQRQAEKAKSAH